MIENLGVPPTTAGRAGEVYIADDPQLAADSQRALELTRGFNASDPADPQARLAGPAR